MGISHSRARSRWFAAGLLALASVAPCAVAADDQPLFQSKPLTDPHTSPFTRQIEGPAVDAEGNLYVVNFKAQNTDGKGTVGRLAKNGTKFELFAMLPKDPNSHKQSIGNGIRFDRDGRMYIADFENHNVFVIEPGERTPKPYFHSDNFHQPNDLAIAADGTLYASDPLFNTLHKSQIWRITRGADGKGHGTVMVNDRPKPGIINGIDLSPDGTQLYVSESDTQMVWVSRIDGNNLRDSRMLVQFKQNPVPNPKPELDGLRVDLDGKVFVARPNAGSIAIIKPDGTLLPEVKTVGTIPSNLTFGESDGRTVFVTQVDGGLVESFRTDRPGREPCLQNPGMC
jgi:sugar lactone lactonase YvrE